MRYRKHGERRGVVRRRKDIPARRSHGVVVRWNNLPDLAAAMNRFAYELAQAMAVPMQQAVEAFARIADYMNEPDVPQSDRATPTALPIPRNSRADQTEAYRKEHYP